MISPEIIYLTKQTSIEAYLSYLGHFPAERSGHQLVYFSPFTDESTPSFYVCPTKNRWNDFSSNDSGDVIRLVSKLSNLSFKDTIDFLLNFKFDGKNNTETSIRSFPYKSTLNGKSGLEIQHIKNLQNKCLISYLNTRKIPLQLADLFLQEAYFTTNGHYKINGQPYFGLAFKNDKGGYEIRTVHKKLCAKPKSITTIKMPGSININLFEGFFDFLSALVHFRLVAPTYTTIILNTVTLLEDVVDQIKPYKNVNTFFDRDRSGMNATKYLKSVHRNIIDQSYLYAGHKDFNDLLTNNKTS